MMSRFFGPGTGLTQQGNDPFNLLQREVNRVFDEVFRGFPAASRGAAVMGGFAPNLDVQETEQGLEIAAELPGMSEQDIDLRLEGDLLTLSGEKKEERAQNQSGLHMTERSFGRFQRSFRLPYRVDPGQVRANFDKGVLHISLPRPQQEQSSGRIQIQANSDQQQGGAQVTAQLGGNQAGAGQPQQTPTASNDPAQGKQGQGKVA